MRRVAAHCIVIGCGMYLAACSPNLPGLQTSAPPIPANGAQAASLEPSAASPIGGTPTYTPTAAAAFSSTASFTPIPTFTATNLSATASATTVAFQTVAAAPGTTPTVLESISLDKLPPGTIYRRVRIENQAHEQTDISLHCTTLKGLHTVIEYNNVKNIAIDAPEGNYVYVFYVGGHRMIGSFSLLDTPSVTITVYKDRVAIH